MRGSHHAGGAADVHDLNWRATLKPGDRVDARDGEQRWYEAVIVAPLPLSRASTSGSDKGSEKGRHLGVHFNAWETKWDASIARDSLALAPPNSVLAAFREAFFAAALAQGDAPGDAPTTTDPMIFPTPPMAVDVRCDGWFAGFVEAVDATPGARRVLVRRPHISPRGALARARARAAGRPLPRNPAEPNGASTDAWFPANSEALAPAGTHVEKQRATGGAAGEKRSPSALRMRLCPIEARGALAAALDADDDAVAGAVAFAARLAPLLLRLWSQGARCGRYSPEACAAAPALLVKEHACAYARVLLVALADAMPALFSSTTVRTPDRLPLHYVRIPSAHPFDSLPLTSPRSPDLPRLQARLRAWRPRLLRQRSLRLGCTRISSFAHLRC